MMVSRSPERGGKTLGCMVVTVFAAAVGQPEGFGAAASEVYAGIAQ